MGLINDFLSLIYPRHCEACAGNLFRHETFLCNHCVIGLPKSNFHLQATNELLRTFEGRVPLKHGLSFYLFEKSGKIQRLLHAIKYHGQKELAEHLGSLYSQDLKDHMTHDPVEMVIPVPLHRNKLKSRGYNQSEWFAKGLSKGLYAEMRTDLLDRVADTATQTKKKKYQRWENVEGIFKLNEAKQLANRHVLLVDDVITTGATIEAACQELMKVEGIRISVASIAFAAKG